MPRVLVTDGIHQDGQDILRNAGLEVIVATLTKEELPKELSKGYDALVIRGATKLTSDVLDSARGLKVIGRQGIGVDNIDIPAASRNGIYVMNTPGSNRHAVCQLVFSAIHYFFDRVHELSPKTLEGGFPKKEAIRKDIRESSIGILGLGAIGFEVAKLAKAYDMKVLGYDPIDELRKRAESSGVTITRSLDDLFGNDVVTLHIPENPKTKNMIGRAELMHLKPGAMLINTARPGIMDENIVYEALAERLEKGTPFYFAQDVFNTEKPVPTRRIPANLIGLGKFILMTPHIGATSDLAERDGSVMIARQIVELLGKGATRNTVNFPQVDTDAQPYMKLAQKMALIANRLLGNPATKLECTLYNGAEPYDQSIAIGALAGAIQQDEPVSFPSAKYFAEKLGLIYERRTPLEGKTGSRYTNAMTIDLISEEPQRQISIRGRITPDGIEEISRIDFYEDRNLCASYEVVFEPKGSILIAEVGHDKPGTMAAIAAYITNNDRDIKHSCHSESSPSETAFMVFHLNDVLNKDLRTEAVPFVTKGPKVYVDVRKSASLVL